MPKTSLLHLAVKNYVAVFTQQATGGIFGGKGRKGGKGVKFSIGALQEASFKARLYTTILFYCLSL